jgi:rhodanese-related sulfurtransferase
VGPCPALWLRGRAGARGKPAPDQKSVPLTPFRAALLVILSSARGVPMRGRDWAAVFSPARLLVLTTGISVLTCVAGLASMPAAVPSAVCAFSALSRIAAPRCPVRELLPTVAVGRRGSARRSLGRVWNGIQSARCLSRQSVSKPQEKDPRSINKPVRVLSWSKGEDGGPFSEIIDVRSQKEYEEDHIPGAINLPCLTNEERHEVGLLYDSSPFEARKVGSAHVCRNMANYLQTHFMSKDKDYRPLVYCWRGGQRSGSVAWILSEVGFRSSVLQGGYKYYRTCIQSELAELPAAFAGKFRMLSGYALSFFFLGRLRVSRRECLCIGGGRECQSSRGQMRRGSMVGAQ